jgi:hypothetical protein
MIGGGGEGVEIQGKIQEEKKNLQQKLTSFFKVPFYQLSKQGQKLKPFHVK